MWGADDLKLVNILRGHRGSVLCLLALGHLLISGARDNTIRWGIGTGNKKQDRVRSLVGLGWRCLIWGEGMEGRPMHPLLLRHLLISGSRHNTIRCVEEGCRIQPVWCKVMN